MMSEGIPGTSTAEPGSKTVKLESTKSTCSHACEKPKKVSTDVEVTKTPAAPADTPALIEKAIDNDAGVILLRLVPSLLAVLVIVFGLAILFPSGDSGEGVSAGGEPEDQTVSP